MKTEMKKNNKMFLALVVVAALAAVSFAGIALSDDSAAAGSYVEMRTGNVVKVDETSTADYNFYVFEGDNFGALQFIVTESGRYTGTIKIGTLSADNVYTSYSEMKLTGASAVQITAVAFNSSVSGGLISLFMIGNIDKEVDGALPAGTYELTKGQVVLGTMDGTAAVDWQDVGDDMLGGTAVDALTYWYTFMMDEIMNKNVTSFCGTVTAGALSVKSSYTIGTMISITAAGAARFSSMYLSSSPTETLPFDANKTTGTPAFYPDYKDRFLSISGTASIQYPEVIQKFMDKNMNTIVSGLPLPPMPLGIDLVPDTFITDSVNVVIEENAVITAGDRATTVAESVKIETVGNVAFAYLIDSDNNIIFPLTPALPSPSVEFEYVCLGTYTLLMGVYDGGNVLMFYGNVTISGSGDNYAISIGTNQLSAYPIPNLALTLTAASIEYNDADYRPFVLAYNVSTNEFGKLALTGGVATEGEIEFDTPAVALNTVIVILKDRTHNGALAYYYGAADGVTNLATAPLKTRTNTATLLSNEIRADDVAAMETVVYYRAGDASKILVKGKMNFLYNSDLNYAIMDLATEDAYLDFEGTGIIAYGIKPIAIPTVPLEIIDGAHGTTRINAAYFYENELSGSNVTKTTYYFTTLKNALTLSGDITLNGKHVILEDTIFSNPDFPTITITLGDGAILEVGKDDSDGTPAIGAILTIPSGTTIVVPSWADHYDVVNGQAVYDVKPLSSDEPGADLLIVRTSPAKYIYTDVGTGLDISLSGDVLELRRDAALSRNATLQEGVTLTDKDGDLIILENVILTVDGTLESKGAMKIMGTLKINKGTANFLAGAHAELSGTIWVTSTGVLNVKGGSTITSGTHAAVAGYPFTVDATKGVIDVEGEANIEGASTDVKVGKLILSGKLNVKTGAVITVNDLLQIGKTPALSPMSGTYSNTASITGKITLTSTAIAKVYGNFALTATGSGANVDVAGSGTLVKTEYMIEGNLYLTVYCFGAEDIPMYYETQLDDIKIKDWYNDPYKNGDSLKAKMNGAAALPPTATVPTIGSTGWTIVYADWEWKMYTVTFNYLQGMKWVSNGIDYAGGAAVEYAYGTNLVVSGAVQPGYEGTPVIKVNGANYVSPFKVTAAASFTATGVQTATVADVNDGLTLIEILLIIIVIIIAVIALIIAIRLLRS